MDYTLCMAELTLIFSLNYSHSHTQCVVTKIHHAHRVIEYSEYKHQNVHKMCSIRHESIEKHKTKPSECERLDCSTKMSYEKEGTRTNIDKWLLNYVPKQRPNFIGQIHLIVSLFVCACIRFRLRCMCVLVLFFTE